MTLHILTRRPGVFALPAASAISLTFQRGSRAGFKEFSALGRSNIAWSDMRRWRPHQIVRIAPRIDPTFSFDGAIGPAGGGRPFS
jgi:hypothetical protein